MERTLEGAKFKVCSTDTTLQELLKKDISDAYSWNDYYFFMLNDDNITVYVVNNDTKKVEWTSFVAFINILEDTTEISPKKLREELSK